MGWVGNNAHLTHQAAYEDIGSEGCPLKPGEFEFELATGKRKPIAAYPWKLVPCPRGGWTSKVGTMVTECDDAEAFERLAKMPQRFRREPEPVPAQRDLPEAVALSENEIFVMEPEEKQPYTWFRGPPKGKGLTFIVDGPSVLRFMPKGVVVEKVTEWRYGTSIFEQSLADDWHLIKTDQDKWALIRLTQSE